MYRATNMTHTQSNLSQSITPHAAARYWRATRARDPRADGSFVLAVRSTHIYCRPSCPARRPLRRNVTFFRTREEAEKQGYRPCLRCRPNEIAGPVVLVKRAAGKLAESNEEGVRLGALAAALGMTPATYRKGGQGMKIGYTIARSPLGKVLVAATERGVSAVYLGDAENAMIAELRQEYPRAEIARATDSFQRWVREIVQRIEGGQPRLELPLDLQATAFQRRVWQELQRIPRGRTRTYSQVARYLGQPKAVRAVARACATNPVSIVVPCHRVIREDGTLAGYRWGLSRKEQLLAQERAAGD